MRLGAVTGWENTLTCINAHQSMERATRIELALSAWEAANTPLWITL